MEFPLTQTHHLTSLPFGFRPRPYHDIGLYLIEGKVTVDYDFPAIEVHRCARMPLKPDLRTE